MRVATLGYGLAAAAFLMLPAALAYRRRKAAREAYFIASCLLSALWAMSNACYAVYGPPLAFLVDITENLRNGAWCLFLLTQLGPIRHVDAKGLLRWNSSVLYLGAFVLAQTFAPILGWIEIGIVQQGLALVGGSAGRVAIAVVGMILVEQLFRNSSEDERWIVKFACIGVGGLFAYDFYMYSDAMLFHRVNAEIWSARGFVNAMTMPLLAVSAARNMHWSPRIAVSRRVLFHSAALFGSSVYLLAMAAAGYYLRYVGGEWGTVAQVAFLFGALVLLVVTLFSGVFRSRLRVFVSKHFFRYSYDYREEWIRFTRALAESGPGSSERAIRAIAGLVESPGGVLFVRRDAGEFESTERWNMSVTHEAIPENASFYQFLETTHWVVDLDEYRVNPAKYDDVIVPRWLQSSSRAWLVVPLALHGKLFGFMVLSQSRSRIKLNWEVLDLLKIAGSQAASYLAQHESANALMVARQFESFNRMSTFVVHDLKNLVSQLSLMIANAEKHRHNPEFQSDMLETVDHSIHKMKLLLHKLGRGSALEGRAPVSLSKLLRQAVVEKSGFEPRPVLQLIEQDLSVYADASRLERVVGHVIQNAIEATRTDGKVTVRLLAHAECAVVEVADDGLGMTEEFIRERLFKPFESTKSAGMGIGVFETREYVNEIGGRLEVFSQPAVGTTFRMTFPLYQGENQAVLSAA